MIPGKSHDFLHISGGCLTEFPEPVHVDRETLRENRSRLQADIIEFPIIATDRMGLIHVAGRGPGRRS